MNTLKILEEENLVIMREGERGIEEEKNDDGRREATMASISSLHPNFKRSGVTQEQLSKLQELHNRRLQIKAKSKTRKKTKGVNSKPQRKNIGSVTFEDEDSNAIIKESSSLDSKNNSSNDGSSTQLDKAPMKRQKLYWGLDTKERWERKANM